MNKILITIPMDERSKKKIDELIGEKAIYLNSKDVTDSILNECEAVIGNIPPKMFKEKQNIKWVQLNSAGANNYTENNILSKNTVLTNSTGAYGLALSEHMLAMVFSLMKKLPLYHENQKNHIWKDEGSVTSIFNSKTLVIGLGDIGSEFAKKMKALGSKVYGIRRNITSVPDYLEGLYKLQDLENILSEFDIIALSLPESSETKNLFNKEKFNKMKRNSIFINVGRGSSVVSEDLCEALNNGVIGGAGLDVTHIEPLPENDKLWNAKNIIITPHIAGGYHLEETLSRIRDISIKNLEAYITGKPMINIVDFKTGYRKFLEK